MFRHPGLDTSKIKQHIVSLATTMLEEMKLDSDSEDSKIIGNFTAMLYCGDKFLSISDLEIKDILKKLAAKEQIRTYLALCRMSSTQNIDESNHIDLDTQEKILNLAVDIKSDYTHKQAEALAVEIIKDEKISKLVSEGLIDEAKCIIRHTIENITGATISIDLIEPTPKIKYHDEQLEAIIGTSPKEDNLNNLEFLSIITPQTTPSNSPRRNNYKLDEVQPSILFTKENKKDRNYPSIPGASPFVTPESSPKKAPRPGAILSSACKKTLSFSLDASPLRTALDNPSNATTSMASKLSIS